MDIKAKAAAYGVAGLALAGIMIFSGTALGVLGPSNQGFNPRSLGVLSILLTDPPSVPEGVTAVYVTYTDVAVHLAGLGDSGWVATGAQGTINTLGLVNLGQTISTSKVPSGTYNLISFRISSVLVGFHGGNYSATVNSGKLEVPLTGGLTLNSSNPGAAVIDIQPTIVNIGSTSAPRFIVAAGARALQVPPKDVSPEITNVGATLSLGEKKWAHELVANHSGQLSIQSVSLTPNSLRLVISNPGPDDLKIKVVVLTSEALKNGHMKTLASLAGSAVFVVSEDGSLQPLPQGTGMSEDEDRLSTLLENAGYELAAGASASFSYSGTISTLASGSGISSGASYFVIVMSEEILAVQIVQAG